jgi:hypothetical protein
MFARPARYKLAGGKLIFFDLEIASDPDVRRWQKG